VDPMVMLANTSESNGILLRILANPSEFEGIPEKTWRKSLDFSENLRNPSESYQI